MAAEIEVPLKKLWRSPGTVVNTFKAGAQTLAAEASASFG
jgi:hypothetical protein